MVAPPPLTTSLAVLGAIAGTFLGTCWKEYAASPKPDLPPEVFAAAPPSDGPTVGGVALARNPGSAGRRRLSPGRDSRRKRRSGRKSPSRTAAPSRGASVDSSTARAAFCAAVVLLVLFGILSFCLWRRVVPAESPELVDLAPGFGDDGLESPVKSPNWAAPAEPSLTRPLRASPPPASAPRKGGAFPVSLAAVPDSAVLALLAECKVRP